MNIEYLNIKLYGSLEQIDARIFSLVDLYQVVLGRYWRAYEKARHKSTVQSSTRWRLGPIRSTYTSQRKGYKV